MTDMMTAQTSAAAVKTDAALRADAYAQGLHDGREAALDDAHRAEYDRGLADGYKAGRESLVERPSLPPVECAPWCADGDGHPGASHVDDQYCAGVELRTSLCRYPSRALTNDTFEPEFATVYPMQNVGAAPFMCVGRGDMPPIELTPDEAQQMIEHMQLVLGQLKAAR